MNSQGKYDKGISFPFRIGGRGGVAMSSDGDLGHLHLHDRIKSFIGTVIGERAMSPDNGVENLDVFFANLNETTKNMAAYKITTALEAWEPDILVQNIEIIEDVQIDGSMAHIISLDYSLRSSQSLGSVNINM